MKITLAIKGRMKAKTASTALPAKILPKRRKENERMRDNSVTKLDQAHKEHDWALEALSKALKLKYLLSCCFGPKAMKPKTWVTITETRANANVRLRSLVPGRTQGISLSEYSPNRKKLVGALRCANLIASRFTVPMVSTPGKTSSKLQNKIKMKKVATSGKNLLRLYFTRNALCQVQQVFYDPLDRVLHT